MQLFLSSLYIANLAVKYFVKYLKDCKTPFNILKLNLYKIYTSVNGYMGRVQSFALRI
jgi:hypothetical protein